MLFMARAVSKDSIGQNPKYRSVARQTVLSLMSVVVLSLFALIPHQPPRTFGAELVCGALVNLVSSSFVQWRTTQQLSHGKQRYANDVVVYNSA